MRYFRTVHLHYLTRGGDKEDWKEGMKLGCTDLSSDADASLHDNSHLYSTCKETLRGWGVGYVVAQACCVPLKSVVVELWM